MRLFYHCAHAEGGLAEYAPQQAAALAAGAVVSRDFEPYTIVAGSPAKPVGTRPTDLRYRCEFAPWMV